VTQISSDGAIGRRFGWQYHRRASSSDAVGDFPLRMIAKEH
jgi:hypothetical protein